MPITVEFTDEQAQFIMDNCTANINMAIMAQDDPRTAPEQRLKIQQRLSQFQDLQRTMMAAYRRNN